MKYVKTFVLILIPLLFILGSIRVLFLGGLTFLPSLDGFKSWLTSFPSAFIAKSIIDDISNFKVIVDSSFNSNFWDALTGIFRIIGNCWNMLIDIIRIPVYVIDWLIQFGKVA